MKIKPCPNCKKSENKIVDGYADAGCLVECTRCGFVGKVCETHEQAIKAWNTRKGEGDE